jgi:DNA mismatch endonuclease Vsr
MAHRHCNSIKFRNMRTDVFLPEKRSAVMAAIRSRDTKPEMLVRRWLHANGYRFILHDRRLPGVPDIVLPRFSMAIEVRGCFWHKHTCADGHLPKSRKAYWGPKLENNRIRDKRNALRLRSLGWKQIVIWECEISAAARAQKKLAWLLGQLQRSTK